MDAAKSKREKARQTRRKPIPVPWLLIEISLIFSKPISDIFFYHRGLRGVFQLQCGAREKVGMSDKPKAERCAAPPFIHIPSNLENGEWKSTLAAQSRPLEDTVFLAIDFERPRFHPYMHAIFVFEC